MSKFTLIPQSRIEILFLADFVCKNYHASIISFSYNKTIWKGRDYYAPLTANIIFNNEAYTVKGLTIHPGTLKDESIGELPKIASTIARKNSTIVFFKNGNYEAVYDFRKVK